MEDGMGELAAGELAVDEFGADELAAAEVAVDDALASLSRAQALGWDAPAGEAFRVRLGDVVLRLQRDGDAVHELRQHAARLRGPA